MSNKRNLGHNYFAVPYDAVTVNGIYIGSYVLPEPYDGPWALLLPSGCVTMGEDGYRPYRYRDFNEVVEDKSVLLELYKKDTENETYAG